MTGVILFRAQPFHNGHLAQIKRAYEDMKHFGGELYIIVGSADKLGTKRNPIPITMRIDLINRSLQEVYNNTELQHIHIFPLEDYSDEANNTHTWGNYLYQHLCLITKDNEFVFYYSDKPEIALSWFHEEIKEHIWFKFLPRVDGIDATTVRELIANYNEETYSFYLRQILPKYVFNNIPNIKKYIINAK